MTEYIRKDIIMDPNDPRLEGAIGKKVYCSSDINLILQRANDNEYEKTLTQVEDVDSEPFTVTDMDGDEFDVDFIIIKKEELKPEYIPFKNAEEFLNAYDCANYSVKSGTIENRLLNYGGIWIKEEDPDVYHLVSEIWDTGIVFCDRNMIISGADVFNDITTWNEILECFTFLDGSPCGKLMEENNG